MVVSGFQKIRNVTQEIMLSGQNKIQKKGAKLLSDISKLIEMKLRKDKESDSWIIRHRSSMPMAADAVVAERKTLFFSPLNTLKRMGKNIVGRLGGTFITTSSKMGFHGSICASCA